MIAVRIICALVLLFSVIRAAGAADDKTLELAKKEGRVNFYTSMGAEESKMVADAFQVKHPDIRSTLPAWGARSSCSG